MRVCVIVPTYKRTKRGVQGPPLRRALESLKKQTFSDFRVYVSGDYYEDEAEFNSICDEFSSSLEIVRLNLGPTDHFRDVLKGQRQKLWCVGGAAALQEGIDLAIRDGMDWYFHLDDDDTWSPAHLDTYTQAIRRNPSVSFVCSKARIGGMILPRENVGDIRPNNYRPKPADSIHATWAIRLDTLGETLSRHYNEERSWAFNDPRKISQPSDARLLGKISASPVETMCLPTTTVMYSGASL